MGTAAPAARVGHDGTTYGDLGSFGHRDGGVLRIRGSKPAISTRLRRSMCVRLGLWMSSRGMDIRACRGPLVVSRPPTLAAAQSHARGRRPENLNNSIPRCAKCL